MYFSSLLEHFAGDWDNPYWVFGWASEVAPDFEMIASSGIGEVKKPETPPQRWARLAAYIDSAKARGSTKQQAYQELAKQEGCGPDNIKRMYDGHRKNKRTAVTRRT